MGNRTRTYHSPGRAEKARQTRERIIAAAAHQFVATGYVATTMRSVASAAGVSVPTVELIFGTKPHLLKAAIDVAIAGDHEPVPMLQREWAARAQATADPVAFVSIFARALRDAAVRSARLILVASEAARSDNLIAALSSRLSEQRATTVTWIVDALRTRTPLREGVSRKMAIDTMWLLMDPIVYQRLTDDRGWTPAQFERWIIDTVCRLVLPPGNVPH